MKKGMTKKELREKEEAESMGRYIKAGLEEAIKAHPEHAEEYLEALRRNDAKPAHPGNTCKDTEPCPQHSAGGN